MNTKRIFALVLLIVGALALGVSFYIEARVQEGREQIGDAQQKVNRAKGIFSLTPVTKSVGQGITGGAQKKINAGKEEVAAYSQLASRLRVGGILLLIVGGGVLVLGRKKS